MEKTGSIQIQVKTPAGRGQSAITVHRRLATKPRHISVIYDQSRRVAVPVARSGANLPGDQKHLPDVAIVRAQPFAQPGYKKQQPSWVLQRNVPKPSRTVKMIVRLHLAGYSKSQFALIGMACFMFVIGLVISLQTVQTNHANTAQVAALSKKASKGAGSPPNETKPSSQAIHNYQVAPDAPRYLKVPSLDIYARVTQVGTDKSGNLEAPTNIFDTAWYNGSAKPGQLGATVIDGHVSGWTAHGVFYNIKNLKAGDDLQVVRGDDAVFNYKVMKTQTYPANRVDMRAVMMPVSPGKPGLNLITCTGKVDPRTNQFDERVVVFAEQQ